MPSRNCRHWSTSARAISRIAGDSIGLAILCMDVDQLRWRIRVDETPGKETTLRFTLTEGSTALNSTNVQS